ncbi:response regulator transcription factor [Roseobacter weihaiensis]|uniref:response regulator transcription factor n=1 Tax=Roseobacter weihaiensis TaxID=2763262 RepID=UPI001D0ADBF9|nr:response regulator transcription factor [Roseobacter sp. H9]
MKILFADDHWIVRASLRHVFERLGIKLEALEAGSYQEAMELLEAEASVGLVVVDLIMPGFHDFEGLQVLRATYPEIPVIVLSVHEDRKSVMRCIELGVVGYVPKTTDAKELSRAFERVLAGDVYFPRDILARDIPVEVEGAAASIQDRVGVDWKVLTSREKEVMSWLGRGMSDAKIADILRLSPNTVRVHVKNIMKKLGLSDRAETIHFAVTNVRNLLPDNAE